MNPFSYGTIARGDNFYDRKEDTNRIVNTLVGGNNVVMLAPRRYGKTSLTFKVMDIVSQQDIVCLYFDFMTFYSLDQLASVMLKRLATMQTPLDRFVSTAARLLRSVRPTLSFDSNGTPEMSIDFSETTVSVQTIADVMDMAERMATDMGKRLLMVFDEFQEITRFEKQGLEAVMRSRIQTHQHVNYLFLGSRTHMLADMFLSKNRPFYSSALVVQISTLPVDETIAFLQQRFGDSSITISQDCCQYIIQRVANIPYYLQLLSAEIWQYMVNNQYVVTKDIIDYCIGNVVELKRDYYHELFDRHSVVQKKLLQALCVSGTNIFSTEFAKRHRFGATSSIQKAVAILQDEGVVDKSNDNYYISDPFFKLWIESYVG